MTKFFFTYQLCKFYPDEFSQALELNKESAIVEFQSYDWERQVSIFKNSSGNVCVPKIIFNDTSGKTLKIIAVDDKQYFLHYQNSATMEEADFSVSTEFTSSSQTVEDFIDLFFESKIESVLKLTSIKNALAADTETNHSEDNSITTENDSKTILSFAFKGNTLQAVSVRTYLRLALVLVYWRLYAMGEMKLSLLGLVILCYLALVPIYLHLSYYFKSTGIGVQIDKTGHQIDLLKNDTKISFTRDDIFRCEIVSGKASGFSIAEKYSYVWFVLHNGKRYVITNFVAPPEQVVESLQCKFDIKLRTVPFLPL